MLRWQKRLSLGVLCCAVLGLALFLASCSDESNNTVSETTRFTEVNLVSDLPNIAQFQDQLLVNSWGIVFTQADDIFVADNGTGVSTSYTPTGVSRNITITIPPPAGGTTAAPTGVVENTTSDFVISANNTSAPATLIFATEDGTVSGWNPMVDSTHAILQPNPLPANAVFKGLAMGSSSNGNALYLTDFHNGNILMLDATFKVVKTFFDPQLPPPAIGTPGFAPFGIRSINDQLYVTYALQKPGQHDDQAGVGNGFVDVFSTDGVFIKRFASRGTLNSPWGLALAPSNFGKFSNALLVGNFGDGNINAFNVDNGTFLGQFQTTTGTTLSISGLWGITFDPNSEGVGEGAKLYFTAGLNDEADGLLGFLQPELVD